MGVLLGRDAILGATALPQETVPVPELGGDVLVRGMTGSERDVFEAGCFEGKGKNRDFSMKDVRAKLVAFCCVDESGRRLFVDGDVEALGKVRADVVDRLFSVAQRLSGMREEDVAALGKSLPSPSSPSSSSVSPVN